MYGTSDYVVRQGSDVPWRCDLTLTLREEREKLIGLYIVKEISQQLLFL